MKFILYRLSYIYVAILVSGCASMPSASIDYYLPKSSASTTVYKTVSCSDISSPVVTTSVEVSPTYSADLEKGKKSISLSDLDAWHSSGDAEITLTEDGRIAAFNSSSTGGGSEIISTFVTLLDAAETAAAFDNKLENACILVNKVAGEKDGKPLPLSIIFKSGISFQADGSTKTTDFKITNYPQTFYEAIAPAIGHLHYEIGNIKKVEPPVRSVENGANIVVLQPALVEVSIVDTSPVSGEKTAYTSQVPVPQWGNEYSVPIPSPPFFGTKTLNLSLYGNGKIKTIKYGTTNGAKELGVAIRSLHDEFTETESEKAAALKAEADVIAQQQRLLKCQKTPKNCE